VSFFDLFKRPKDPTIRPEFTGLVKKFENLFNCRFKNPDILIRALTHRSYIHYDETFKKSNERLEYLGDSVLGLVIAEYLFSHHPNYNEGDLTKTKSLLVDEITLSRVGQESGLNELVIMSPDEERSGGRSRNSIVSDTVEAIIAAIYLDCGLEAARMFIHRTIVSRVDEILSDTTQRNYKGELLEFLQGQGLEPPRYEVASEVGPDHQKSFEVVVLTGGVVTGKGIGQSKKEAEQLAASQSLASLAQKGNEGSSNQ